jgi:trimeric autotransporter adhesin
MMVENVRRTWCGLGVIAWAALAGGSCRDDSTTARAAPLTEGTLPGGTPILVDVVTPDDGEVLAAGVPIPITGFAQVEPLEPVPDTALVIVLDVSGSTNNPALPGCGGDANHDGQPDTVLDCEIAAALALIEAASAAGTIGEIGIVVFATTAAIGDVGPAAGLQVLTGPDTDADGDGVRDLEEVLVSAFSQFGGDGGLGQFSPVVVGVSTSYGSGVEQAIAAVETSALPNRQVVFLSDGLNEAGPPVASVIGADPPVIHTFAVGALASCTAPNANGDLADIAALTGGTCTHVPDPEDLPDVLPGVIAAQLIEVVVTIDGGALPTPLVLPTATVPALPGPTAVTFQATAPGQEPGLYAICATAFGQDVGEPVSVTDCVQVRVNAPPVAVCAPREVAADEACQGFASIDDGSFDPDGDDFVCVQAPPGPYPLGPTAATLTCTDEHGAADACGATVTVVDLTPPVISAPGALPSLWPPNHTYRAFTLSDCAIEVEDNCEIAPGIDLAGTITHITSDEPENATGDGNTCDDAVITGSATALLRAERRDHHDGRVYRVHFVVEDAAGNQTPGSCAVQVVHDQSPHRTPAGEGPCAYCVGPGCDGSCPTSSPGC